MEEDIKLIEENIKNGTIYVHCGYSVDKALENLLKRYKELEEENKSSKETINILTNKLEKVVEDYKELEEENETWEKAYAELKEENKQLEKSYKIEKLKNVLDEQSLEEALEKMEKDYVPISVIQNKITPVIDELEKDGFVGYADELRDILDEIIGKE